MQGNYVNNYDSEIFCGIKERSFRGFESNNAFKIWDGTHQNHWKIVLV